MQTRTAGLRRADEYPARYNDTRFRGDIQGLRAIAVLAVVLYHAGVPFLPGGYVGVDVFFVISGFLITTHLLQSLEREGRVRFASFYAKRVRRILPASFVVLVLSVIAALLWFPPLLMKEVWRGAVATALYVPNMLFAFDRTDYLAEETPSLFQHYWSLGVEEQFYIVWPLLLVLGWRLVRTRRALFYVLLVLIVASFGACVILTYRAQPFAFFLLPTRAWELGVGGMVAVLMLRRQALLPPHTATAVGWIGLVLLTVPIFLFSATTAFPGYWAAVPVVGTALVIVGGGTAARYSPSGVLSLRGMMFLGTVSYSLYLVHWPALQITQAAVGYAKPLTLWMTLLIAALCVPAAWIIYRLVEDPARNAPWLASYRPRRTLVAAIAGSATCVMMASFAFAHSETKPLDAGQTASATSVGFPPVATDYVPSNLEPSLSDVESDLPLVSSDGCHQDVDGVELPSCRYGASQGPRVVLFGDSHGAQWGPALRAAGKAHGYAVEIRTKNSCPSIDAPAVKDGVPYTACEEWREAVVAHLNEDPPELVILTSYGLNELHEIPDRASVWQRGYEAMIRAIDAPVAVLADTPHMGATPSICLSGHLEDAKSCGLPRDEALKSPTRSATKAAAANTGVAFIDLTDYFCDSSMCHVIFGNTLAYRDAHHITATFSERLGPVLGEKLRPLVR